MKRRLAELGFVMLLIGLSVPSTATAQTDAPGAGQPSPPPSTNEADSERQGRREDGRLRRLTAQLDKLREALHEELSLTKNQTTTIDELFREHIKDLRQAWDRRAADPKHEAEREELKQLRERHKEAHESGDSAAIREARKALQDATKRQRNVMTEATSEFLTKVEAALNEDQVSQFKEMRKRFRLDGSDETQVDELRVLMRAARGPELELSPEQKQKLNTIISGAFLTLDPTGEDESMRAMQTKLREDIMKELTPEQKIKLEAMLKNPNAAAETNKSNERSEE